MTTPSPQRSNSCDPQPHATPVELRPARPTDVPAVHELLAAESLPLDGANAHLMRTTIVAVAGDAVVGSASVEVHGTIGLLRSVVLTTHLRGHRWGRRLVEDRVGWARARGLRALVLFTETADAFFARLGFEPVPRERLPREVHGSFEFGFCPASSTSMRLTLDHDQ